MPSSYPTPAPTPYETIYGVVIDATTTAVLEGAAVYAMVGNDNTDTSAALATLDPSLETGFAPKEWAGWKHASGKVYTGNGCTRGQSPHAILALARDFDYSLVAYASHDLILIHNSQLPRQWPRPVQDVASFIPSGASRPWHTYRGTYALERGSADAVFTSLVDYNVYAASGSVHAAREAARTAIRRDLAQTRCWRDALADA